MSADNQSTHESLPRGNSGRLPRLTRRGTWISRIRWQAALALFASGIMLMPAMSGQAQEPQAVPTYTILHSFPAGSTDGEVPFAGVIRDFAGNLYGTTSQGPNGACMGVVFKLAASGAETVLHDFCARATSGWSPNAGVIRDSAGNLYGTTLSGGPSDVGVVFKVTPSGTETVLHSFAGGATDGRNPVADLIRDLAGNLYGTTPNGGAFDNGVVFKLSAAGALTVLYSFAGSDGQNPHAGLIRDSAGNFYGTGSGGGTTGQGVVFKLSAAGALTVLHSFAGGATDGTTPRGRLIRDSAGNLYGTTYGGGPSNVGVVFKVTPSGTETVLHSFAGAPADGTNPYGGLARDSAGNLYGTTVFGGAGSCNNGSGQPMGCGTIFKLTPGGTETVLHSFAGYPTDGDQPYTGSLIRDSAGNLYGNTTYGGANGGGIVFKLTP